MRGGKKKKIDILKKLESKEQRAVAFSKRRNGLFKKVAKLSVASGAATAIFADSPSENCDAIFSFFANSNSAYEIADCFLNNKIPSKPNPRPNPNPSFNPNPNPNPTTEAWWEDVEPASFMDPNLMDYLDKTEIELMASLTRKIQNQSVPLFQNPNHLHNQIPHQIPHQIPYEITNEFTNELSNELFLQILSNEITNDQLPNENNNEITNDQLPNESPYNEIGCNQVLVSNGGGGYWGSEIEEEEEEEEEAPVAKKKEWWQELEEELEEELADEEGTL